MTPPLFSFRPLFTFRAVQTTLGAGILDSAIGGTFGHLIPSMNPSIDDARFYGMLAGMLIIVAMTVTVKLQRFIVE
ncbi:hypothetical protein [Burkholderia gladioli]|uniref:hypothetical protein n=1 Tax=Burkholderia gladioli TaxID=28095 RepID=UPI0019067B1D|nr:hypothetical protein [Burkholderia gladioli]MBJ9659131.1 hypothetical protein [Burkholderia gladioli]